MAQPTEHIQEALKLTADAQVDLYEVTLRGTATVVYLSTAEELTWQGQTYESIAISMSGDSRTAEGQESKPTLMVQNPAGIFNTYIQDGTLDLATVKRKRVLRRNLEADLAIYEQRMWYINRIYDVISGQSFSCELRSMSEGPNFWVPARTFTSPEFPSVSL